MKAATGELNLTVITLIAIAAIVGLFWAFFPKIKETINTQWEKISGVPGENNSTSTPAVPGIIILDSLY